jgi:thioredoxin type arsenate reductase
VGSAESWQAEADRLREAAPKHVLFLCVANSARSQMAEGIARSLATSGMKISSAGSEPTSVRPQAVQVLGEIGIDAREQRSKGVDDVERPVDAVITLCAEEVCPVWMEEATRLHWGLPDPAAVEGSEDDKLDAFREVRDELLRRLRVLFAAGRD